MVQELLQIDQVAGHVRGVIPVLIEICLEADGNLEQDADVVVAGFGGQPGDDIIEGGMVVMRPTASHGHGFDDLGGGGPALLGGLTGVAGGEFLMRLRQQVAAGGLTGLRCHKLPPTA